MNNNRCIVCGEIIPEGRMVCPTCARKTKKKSKKQQQAYLLSGLIGCLINLVFCRACCVPKVQTVEVEVPVETIVYVEQELKFDIEAQQVARVLYGVRDYQLSDNQKIAVIEVILNRAADNAREFRTVNTITEVCNQPGQWQGYSADGCYIESDYQLALQRLNDNSGARVIPEGCYFLNIAHGTVTVRTEWTGGNEWRV